MKTVLGIDVGEKKIGLALGRQSSEGSWSFVRPALLVSDWAEAWPAIRRFVADEGVTEIIVGLPLTADGQTGPQAQRTREFIATLRSQVTVPILERDERQTSQAVQHEQADRPLSRGQEDSLAAQLLVESYLQEAG